jgi:hypothetical protein
VLGHAAERYPAFDVSPVKGDRACASALDSAWHSWLRGPFVEGGSNELGNLALVRRNCHTEADSLGQSRH